MCSWIFLTRFALDASVERKVSRSLHRANDDINHPVGIDEDCRNSQEFVPDLRKRLRKKLRILFLTLGGISSGRIERVTETVFL